MIGPVKEGQRWVSTMEPELGLGTVVEADARTALVRFPSASCERRFAVASAPLTRVRFSPGDTVKSRDGRSFIVDRVEEKDGTLIYFGSEGRLPECDLSDALSFTTPRERLLGGFLDSNAAFDLRMNTLEHYSALLKSPMRGFLGARIDLLPHQVSVAAAASALPFPRILLSDETGLGKTIEACLILHRLLLTGPITRVLILVPEPLVHQWFVELLRKFSMVFRIFDAEYCASIARTEPEANPFLKDQLCLCALSFLLEKDGRAHQAVEAGWDAVVVDEAHHLVEGGPAYELVRTLGGQSPGLLLLTATPEQLGRRSHFARLHLLDPRRYPDFEAFMAEEKEYAKTARLVESLIESQKPASSVKQKDSRKSGVRSREIRIAEILDRRGIGRAVFRNTRAFIAGFPKREVYLVPLAAGENALKSAEAEFRTDAFGHADGMPYDFARDPRIVWLVNLLNGPDAEKVLLICGGIEKARAVDSALHGKIRGGASLFHEQLSLMERDRNAACFARKDGAQVLICSEIGSEGRNFQFARSLVLFDLPLNPELLEQRIGRIDRIGQRHVVRIYVPFIARSPQEFLARWYHEGLNAFARNVPGVWHIHQRIGKRVPGLALAGGDQDAFLDETRRECEKTARRFESGHDKLLERRSFDPEASGQWVRAIRAMDLDGRLKPYLEALLDSFGVHIEKASGSIYRLCFDALSDPAFPLPPMRDENLSATFDRDEAVSREDVEFLSWDHPMVTGAMNLVLGSEKGNSAAALWPGTNRKEMLLEAVFVLECVAPPRLHVHRFLPPAPVRVVVNHRLEERTAECEQLAVGLRGVPPASLMQNAGVKALLPKMAARCEELALESSKERITAGLREMETALQGEIDRLRELNRSARKQDEKGLKPPPTDASDDETAFFLEERSALRKAIQAARPRLDALRLIFKS